MRKPYLSRPRRLASQTEQQVEKQMEKVQLEVDNGIKKVDEIIANKEKDLMQV